MATVDDLLASGGELRGLGELSKLDTVVGPNGKGGGQLDRIEGLLKGVAATSASEVAQAASDLQALEAQLSAGFTDLKSNLASSVGQAVSDLKAALANLSSTSGGLTPAQDAHLQAAAAAAAQIEAQLTAGLKLDIPLGSIDVKGTVQAT